jgi:AraC-like DNA-binding protein
MDGSDIEMVPAPERLRPFVRRYLYANHQFEGPVIIRPKPTGYIYFSNRFGSVDTNFVVVDGHKFPLDSRWHFAGQIIDHDITVHHSQRHEVIYCELSATALHRLFDIPGERITGKAPRLSDMRPEIEPLARAHFVLGPRSARDEHVEEANAFILALAERTGPGDRLVEGAVAMFEAANGAVRVTDICEELGTDQRTLNRRFKHIVGVNPKFFGQILQINWVVGLLLFQRRLHAHRDGARGGLSRSVPLPSRHAAFLQRRPARIPGQRPHALQGIPRLIAPLRPKLVCSRVMGTPTKHNGVGAIHCRSLEVRISSVTRAPRRRSR